MQDSRAAKRYARALFSAAQKQNCVNDVDADLAGVVAVLQSSPKFKDFMVSPVTNDKDKTNLIDKTFSGRVNPLTLQMLHLLVAKGRDGELLHIQLEYSALRRQSERIVKAVIESAVELDEAQKNAVVAKIGNITGNRVEPEYRVDPRLIGGVKVTYDNYVLDGTARGYLDKMKETLIYDLLKQS